MNKKEVLGAIDDIKWKFPFDLKTSTQLEPGSQPLAISALYDSLFDLCCNSVDAKIKEKTKQGLSLNDVIEVKLTIEVIIKGSKCTVTVDDNGPGFSEKFLKDGEGDTLEKVSNPQYIGGMGKGLEMVKTILSRQQDSAFHTINAPQGGARIRMESPVHELELPLTTEQVKEQALKPRFVPILRLPTPMKSTKPLKPTTQRAYSLSTKPTHEISSSAAKPSSKQTIHP